MAVSVKRIKSSDGTGNASVATVQTLRAALATTIHVDTVAKIYAGSEGFYATMGTPHTFTDPITSETITVISEASAVDFQGHIDTGNIIIDAIAPGYTDAGSKVGDIIIIRPTTSWANNASDTMAAGHKDDGTHGNITVDSVVVNGTNQDLSNQYLYANAIINGGCMIAQRAAPTISTSYQYGKVDRFAAKGSGTAVSAGTVNQLTSSLLAATKGYDLQLAGVTITGTGIAYLRYRIEAKDSLAFVNAVASFGCRVYHNVGSSVNYTIFIRKANAADNFSAVTDIANSGAISVATATATAIKFENINSGSLGDVSNGIEIEIQIACGAVTTKNFNFAEFVFARGAKAPAYMPRSIQHELMACQRYFEKSYNSAVTPGTNISSDKGQMTGGQGATSSGSAAFAEIFARFSACKRTSPTVTVYDGAGTSSRFNISNLGNSEVTGGSANLSSVVGESGIAIFGGYSTSGQNFISAAWTADAEL